MNAPRILRSSYSVKVFDHNECAYTVMYRDTNLTPDHCHVLKYIWVPSLSNSVRKSITEEFSLLGTAVTAVWRVPFRMSARLPVVLTKSFRRISQLYSGKGDKYTH